MTTIIWVHFLSRRVRTLTFLPSDLSKLKNHNLTELLLLSGKAGKLNLPRYKSEWSYVLNNWSPERRYAKVGTATAQSATEMIEAVEKLLRAI